MRIQEVGYEKTEEMLPFYFALFCSKGNKTKLVLFCDCSSMLGGYEVTSVQESLLTHLKGFCALLLK